MNCGLTYALKLFFRNALSLAVLEKLKENLLNDIRDVNLRVIVISANGPVFSSGHDLKELVSAFSIPLT